MPVRAELDQIDLKILRELQRNGRITNVELSERVGISAPPCLRRLRKLENAGIIKGYRALLDAPSLGFDLVAFCMIGLTLQAEINLRAFAESAIDKCVSDGIRPVRTTLRTGSARDTRVREGAATTRERRYRWCSWFGPRLERFFLASGWRCYTDRVGPCREIPR